MSEVRQGKVVGPALVSQHYHAVLQTWAEWLESSPVEKGLGVLISSGWM